MAGRIATGRMCLLGGATLVVGAYALHHGSYSLSDRQVPALLIWFAIAILATFGELPAARPSRAVWAPFAALVGLAAWTLLSLTWTESAERSFDEFTRIVGYLGVLVIIWLTFKRSTWRLAAAGMLAAGVAVCALIVLSRLWPSLFPADSVARAVGTSRINYPFGYWNAVGCWSAMTITLCVAWASHARSGATRALALAAVPVCALALYFALSRAGVGGAAVGALLVVLLGRNRWLTFLQGGAALGASLAVILLARKQFELVYATGTGGADKLFAAVCAASVACGAVAYLASRVDAGTRMRMKPQLGRGLGIATGILALVAVVAAVGTYGDRAINEFQGKQQVDAAAQSGDQRLAALNGNRHNIWDSAWQAFESAPLTGIGPGTFEYWWGRNGVNGEFLRDAHNIYLETLAELGVVGFILLLTFFAGLLVAALRARSALNSDDAVGKVAGLIAVFCVFLLQAGVDWMWESTAIAVFALSAVALAATAAAEGADNRRPASTRASIVLASGVAIATLLPGLAMTNYLDASTASARSGDRQLAITQADEATSVAPWAASAFAQRALAKESSGDLRGASADIAIAERKEPTNWRWPFIATRIYAARGKTAPALSAYRRARALKKYAKEFGVKSPEIR